MLPDVEEKMKSMQVQDREYFSAGMININCTLVMVADRRKYLFSANAGRRVPARILLSSSLFTPLRCYACHHASDIAKLVLVEKSSQVSTDTISIHTCTILIHA